ncbi:MAG: transketolase C-terminal domain-containing protein [Thermodesulfobacteriota bacterium]
MEFPIDLSTYRPIRCSLTDPLQPEEKARLIQTIELVRDSIVFFTAYANKKGLGGHTGGAYDIVPELLIVDGFLHSGVPIYPVPFDEAGHRVAAQYILAALNGHISFDDLLHYREFGFGLYGHPERDDARGIGFSSGRLGHLWSHVNGLAEAYPDRCLVLFGSDGSQQEGNDAEAARYAVARNLNVKLFIDDNDVTIAGHPSRYMKGYDVAATLAGHGMRVDVGDGESFETLYERIRLMLAAPGPIALINRRRMAPGVEGIEGSPKGHDVIAVDHAIQYLSRKGHSRAVSMLQADVPKKPVRIYRGSSETVSKNRDDFGKIVCDILAELPDRKQKVLVVDSDLEGSCGLHHIRKRFPEVYVHAGIMERNNFSVAAGFGSEPGRLGIFGTFSAFLEMLVSEITMARLNHANVLAHFSHAGVDDMADNTCHFGINIFFADNAIAEGDTTRLYFPADTNQLRALLRAVFFEPGLRFVFSTRSAVPVLLNESGAPFFGPEYRFTSGSDDVIRDGEDAFIVSYGEMLYRCLDAVERLKEEGHRVGLINKATLNVVDEAMLQRIGAAKAVLVVESQNVKTGLGSKLGTWLLERGLTPKYRAIGVGKLGRGGLDEQIPFQGLDPEDIYRTMRDWIA